MAKKKQTLIMIHGFRGTHHGLHKIAAQLSEYNTLIPDLPGFGSGETLSRYDLDSYVTWLHRYIASKKLQSSPILLGHSFGSIITAAYAQKYPETIAKLILVNPIGAPALEGPRGILTKLAQGYYWIGRQLPERAGKKWLSLKSGVFIMSIVMTKTKDKTLRQWIKQQHYLYFSRFHSAKSVSEGFTTSVSHSVRDTAKRIPTETLLVVGEKDDITPLSKQRELQKLFPNAQLRIIKNVGHLSHYETPDEVAFFIKAFTSK